MKTKLFICLALFAAILIGVSCGEASAQSKKDVYEKRVDEGSNEFYVDHHSDKDHHRNKKDRDDKDWDPKRKYDLLEKEIWEAVKAGKISERDAKEKLEGLREEMFGGHYKDHHAEKHEQQGHHHEQHEHGMDEVMIAVQVLKRAVETGRMEHHHAKDMLWDLLTGEGEEHHRHGEEEREREGHHHEEEREREERHHEEEREREERHHEGEHDVEGEEALYEALARGLEAAVELGKLSKEEAEEIWRDMTEGDEEENEE